MTEPVDWNSVAQRLAMRLVLAEHLEAAGPDVRAALRAALEITADSGSADLLLDALWPVVAEGGPHMLAVIVGLAGFGAHALQDVAATMNVEPEVLLQVWAVNAETGES